jgi:membrane protein DedA with SNARE-associated domain
MIEQISARLLEFSSWAMSTLGYSGVVLLMAIESACIPFPSEIIMPLAGYLAFTGRFNLYMAATMGALGCNLGSWLAYEVGSYGGRPLVEKYGRYVLLNAHDLEITDRLFHKYGEITILISRMLPVVRTFIALPAGIARMPRLRFHLYTFVGSWPWCFGLAYAGMKLAANWRTLGKYFHRFDAVIAVVIVGGVTWFVWSHWKNRLGASQ